MAAQYPSNPRAFQHRVDRVDVNAAQDINDLQDEVVATQTVLGRNPATSSRFPSATTVADRVTQFEDNVMPRAATLESRMLRAAVSTKRLATQQFNSSALWQSFIFPDVVSNLNDFGTALQLYDPSLGHFYSVAASPAIWSVSASVVWEGAAAPAGSRGLALITQAGTLLAATRVPAATAGAGEDITLNLHWTGRLPVDPTYWVGFAVLQTQNSALNIRADAALTPCRADYTHIPG